MKRYDLSRIMTRAHYIFGHTFNTTFSYCLTKAWTEAKEEARISEENARRAAEYKAKYGNRDYRNYRSITVHAWDAMTGDATTAMMPKQQSSARSMQDDGCI